MAKVVLPLEVARSFAAGVTEHQVQGGDVRRLLKDLEQSFPGIAERLGQGFAIAIDGQIYQDWFVEKVRADSEVYFLPAIEGG
jgi:molybdopterin converting factor small subunit